MRALSPRTALTRLAAGLLGLAAACGCAAGTYVEGARLPARLAEARDLAGVDPQRARAAIAPLREDAVQRGRLDWRFAADEVECRLLTDMEPAEALRVANAGLQAGGSAPPAAAQLAWLRLRACRADALIETGDTTAGRIEIEAVIAAAQGDALRPARALALLERGVHRSRSGELIDGQKDLIEACAALDAPGLERDLDLCLAHMANHYKRMGDLGEALHLFQRLDAAATARGATFDEGVFAHGLAQVHAARGEWALSLQAFEKEARISQQLHDDAGLAYAEHGIAAALRELGRVPEALEHVDRATALLPSVDDPKQSIRTMLLRAQLMAGLGRAEETVATLQSKVGAVRDFKDEMLLADWLSIQAEVLGRVGRWREAYAALQEWRTLDARQQQQRRSEMAARQRMQFSRERDAVELASLRRLNEQGQVLRHTQGVALALGVLLMLALVGLVLYKIGQARRLQALASTDELTGLPNRRALIAAAEGLHREALRAGSELSVLMIDVDHFKRINDSLGHAMGDQVLRHLARLLVASLRNHDRVGRLGGEEFLAVLPGASLAQAAVIAERMRESIAASPLVEPVGELSFTVSIGAAAWDDPNENFAALLARADAALYRAKEGGRNVVALDEIRARLAAQAA